MRRVDAAQTADLWLGQVGCGELAWCGLSCLLHQRLLGGMSARMGVGSTGCAKLLT